MSSDAEYGKLPEGGKCRVGYLQSKRRTIILVGCLISIVILFIILAVFLVQEKKHPKFVRRNPKDEVYAHGAVASDSGTCSEIGRDVLKRNGTAMDAAVATEFCLGLLLQHSTGIGGGGFAVLYKKETGKTRTYDFRETAPGEASRDMYLDPTKSSRVGGLATGVPGFVKGLHKAWRLHGVLPWKQLLQPTIDMAENGFVFSYALYDAAVLSKDFLYKDPGFRELFFDEDGDLKREGEMIKDPQLADTMREIARDPDSFYTGKLAKDVAADIRDAGGIVTEEDLENYKIVRNEPINMAIGDKQIFTMRPPSSGAVVAMILNILQGYNLTSSDLDDRSKAPLTYHRIVEAFKFAYAYRAMLGDDAFVNTSVVDDVMLKTDKASEIRREIQDDKTHKDVSFYGGYYSQQLNPQGTSHTSIISANGDAVAVTTTINFFFGAKYRSKRTGIVYNNEMDDFSTPGKANAFGFEPHPSNYIEPGKRPMSSMSPVIVLDDKTRVRIVSGASGGSRIITGTAQTLINALWFNRTAWEAVTLPRVHHQLLPNEVQCTTKEGFAMPETILDGLEERGHKIKKRSMPLCVTQTITTEEDGTIYAKSDPRKSAWAAGY